MSIRVSRWGTVDLDGDDVYAELVLSFVRLFDGCGRFRLLGHEGLDEMIALGWSWGGAGPDASANGDRWLHRIKALERRGFEHVT